VAQLPVVLRSDDPRRATLEAEGWRVIARSWAAQLEAGNADRDHLARLMHRAAAVGTLRELTAPDTPAALDLDARTLDDYPGGVATAHAPMTPKTAAVSPNRRGFGVARDDTLIAMTFVDRHGTHAETDFTVVASQRRGRGLGTAVKAASVLALLDDGVGVFRTGGSADNAASIAANRAVGYVIDEEWLTLAPELKRATGGAVQRLWKR
jgi:hypothetical protein